MSRDRSEDGRSPAADLARAITRTSKPTASRRRSTPERDLRARGINYLEELRGGGQWVQIFCTGSGFHEREDIVPVNVTADGRVSVLVARTKPGRYRGPSYGFEIPGRPTYLPRSAHELQCPRCTPSGRGLWRISDQKLAEVIGACIAAGHLEVDMSRRAGRSRGRN